MDRVARAYIDLYRRASQSGEDAARVADRVFDRGWDLLVHGSRWDDTPVAPDVQQAIAELVERAAYVADEEGLISWLDTLPRAAEGYLEPAGYDLHFSDEFPGVQTSFVAMAGGEFVAAIAETSGYRVQLTYGDGSRLDSDAGVAERDLVAA